MTQVQHHSDSPAQVAGASPTKKGPTSAGKSSEQPKASKTVPLGPLGTRVFFPPDPNQPNPTAHLAGITKPSQGKGTSGGLSNSPFTRGPVFTRPPPRPELEAPAAAVPAAAPQEKATEVEETVSSPYVRPSRMPLGQLDPVAFAARFGPKAAKAILAEEDPAQGKDTCTVYSWPPPDPQDPRWLAQMQWGIEEDGLLLQSELERVRALVDSALVESTLAEAELEEEERSFADLLAEIAYVAGGNFVDFLEEEAERMWVPLYEEDEYEDEYVPEEEDTQAFTHGFTEDYTGPPIGLRQFDDSEMMDNTRPSDTLSYFDPDPRTSPLANRHAKRRADEQLDSAGSPKRMRSNAPEPTSAARSLEYPGSSPARRPRAADNAEDEDAPSRSRSQSRSPSPYVDGEEAMYQDGEKRYPTDEGALYDDSYFNEERVDSQDSHHDHQHGQYYDDDNYARSGSPSGSDASFDSQWSDLVSPDAPPPRGWPDNMSPRWDWLKEMTCYDLYKNPIRSPKAPPFRPLPKYEEEADELKQADDDEAGPSGSGDEDTAEKEGESADVDVPAAEEQAEELGVDVTEERAIEENEDEEMAEAADEAEVDLLEDDEVDQLQDDNDDNDDDAQEDEAGPSQPLPVTPPPRRRRRYVQSSVKKPTDPFNPTPPTRDYHGRRIDRRPPTQGGPPPSPCIT